MQCFDTFRGLLHKTLRCDNGRKRAHIFSRDDWGAGGSCPRPPRWCWPCLTHHAVTVDSEENLTYWRVMDVTRNTVVSCDRHEKRDSRTRAAVPRRRRPNVGVAPAPFSWRVHVMLYTSYMLLAFCNFFYNEAWTLTERTTRACFAIALDAQTKHGGVKAKVFSGTVCENELMLKVLYGTSLVIGLIKRMVQWQISTACTVITAYKVAK